MTGRVIIVDETRFVLQGAARDKRLFELADDARIDAQDLRRVLFIRAPVTVEYRPRNTSLPARATRLFVGTP